VRGHVSEGRRAKNSERAREARKKARKATRARERDLHHHTPVDSFSLPRCWLVGFLVVRARARLLFGVRARVGHWWWWWALGCARQPCNTGPMGAKGGALTLPTTCCHDGSSSRRRCTCEAERVAMMELATELARRMCERTARGMLLERPRSMSQFPVLAPPEGLESSEHEEHELELPLSLEMSCQTSESVVVQSASGVVLANHSRIVDEYSTFQMVLESISHSVHEVETAACDADAETAIAPSDDTQASAVVASDDTAAGESGDAAGLVQATATNSASSSSSATKWDSRLDSLVEGRDYKVARRTDKAVDLLFASGTERASERDPRSHTYSYTPTRHVTSRNSSRLFPMSTHERENGRARDIYLAPRWEISHANRSPLVGKYADPSLRPLVVVLLAVPKMLSVLAYEQVPDMEDIDMILWTYHRHVKAKELLSFLNLRFLLPTPPDASDDLKAFYNQYARDCALAAGDGLTALVRRCRVPVRMRVVNVCKRWIEARYLDFKNDPDLLSYVSRSPHWPRK